MKRFPLFGATFVLGLIAFATHAQTQNSMTTTNYVQTTKIVGMKVKDANGEAIGTIKDVVLDRETGCMAYTVISTGDPGTRITGTTKTVAVPWAVYNTVSDPSVLTLMVDRERVYGAPAFEYSRINEYSTSTYINNVYSYYGVQPSGGKIGTNAESSPGVSGPASTSAQTTASPVATVSPSPSLTPVTPSPTPSSPTPTPTASLSPTAKAKAPWAEAATKRASATPSASASEREERSEEETTSPASKGRSHREEASPATSPSARPTQRATRRPSQDSEADESGLKSSTRSPSSAEVSPTP
jgi:sporulation protein YlmC with PRC-barrel domain